MYYLTISADSKKNTLNLGKVNFPYCCMAASVILNEQHIKSYVFLLFSLQLMKFNCLGVLKNQFPTQFLIDHNEFLLVTTYG